MKRVQLVLETAVVLYIIAGVAALAVLTKEGHLTLQNVGLALSVPSIATVVFAGIGLAVPELFAVGKLRYPLIVTLPLIYVALMLLIVTLWTRVDVAIRRISEEVQYMAMWANWWLNLLLLGAGIAVFSLMAVIGKNDPQR